MKWFKKFENGLRYTGLLVLAMASFSFAMVQGGFVSWFLFAAFLPVVLYSSFLFIYPIEKIHVQRELANKEFVAGETVPARLHITLPWRIPIPYLFIHDRVIRKRKNHMERSWHSLQVPFFKKTLVCEYEIPQISRGEFTFTDIEMTIADLFGFVRKTFRKEVPDQIIVYPATIPLHYYPDSHEFEYGTAKTKDLVQRDTTIAVSVREYQQGDRFSWINWKASARRNELMTKEFEQRKNHDVLFVLDRSPCEQFELLVTFCASMITAVQMAGVDAGLYSMGEEREYIPPHQGEAHRKKIFLTLARIEDDASLELARVFQTDFLFRQHIQHIVIIVHTLKNDLTTELVELAKLRKQISVFVIKGKNEQFHREEFILSSTLKQRGIAAEFVREGEFADALSRGEVG